MSTSESSRSSYWFPWQSASGAEVRGTAAEPERFNFLSFLATAQALQIQFLPIVWETGRGLAGTGGTSIIQQSLLSLDTSFAFKTYHKRNQSEHQVFRTLIAEITILSQPFIQEHANIAQLQGICWDISPADDKPWPVLVFEKSHLGDLYHFVRHGGRDMTVDERLGLCVDIGRAIMDMHSNQIVHGDIKPENVLVFTEKSGRYSARVIDFGYSSRYIHDEQQLMLPRSEPWNAPENNGRSLGWTPSRAVKADIFCFGMLCFWLLFEPCFSETTPPPQSLEATEDTLRRMKGKFPAYAQQLLTSETTLSDDSKQALKELFDSSLSQDPEQREIGSLNEFLRRLDSPRTNNPGSRLTNTEQSIHSSDFEIENSINEFYRTDYRVRSYIRQCLIDSHSQSTSIALQAAFCCYIGFGATRDEAKAKQILNRSNQKIQTIQDMIAHPSQTSQTYSVFTPSTISDLDGMGLVPWSNFTDLYLEQGRVDEAEARLTQETDDLISTCGTDHFLAHLSREMLASIYSLQGRWEEAEQLEVRGIKFREVMAGADHPSTLSAMANLATTFRKQGRWQEAEKLNVQVMEARKVKLGTEHPDTLTSMANLATTFRNQGRWKEAEQLNMQVIETEKVKLGEDHPETLITMANLASALSDQGRWDEAELLEVQVLETRKAKFGADHPDTLSAMANLATTFWNQGRWEEAEKLNVQALETRKAKLGANHPDTLTNMANLAATFCSQGRWKEAEQLEVQVLETCKVKLGADHPATLSAMANLATTFRKQGRWQEAEKLNVQVMETSKIKFGADHPATLTSIAGLASVYEKQDRWEDAEPLRVQVLETRKAKLGADHPETLASMSNLALLYGEQGQWEKAEQLHVQATEKSKAELGEDHPETLASISNLALIFWNQGRFEEAEQLNMQVIETEKVKLGEDHPETLISMSNLAEIFCSQGRWEEAEQLEVQVLETRKVKLGGDHPSTLRSIGSLAGTWNSQGRHEEALALMKDCAQAQQRILGQTHRDTLFSSFVLNLWSNKVAYHGI